MYAGKGKPCAFDSGSHVGVRRLNMFELNLFVSSSHIYIYILVQGILHIHAPILYLKTSLIIKQHLRLIEQSVQRLI